MSGKRTVQFFYDVLSPYSFIGYKLLRQVHLPKWENVEIEYKPVSIGGLFKLTKNKPPAFVPAKGDHMPTDLKRFKKYGIVDINVPDNVYHILFEKGSMKAQRLLTLLDMEKPELVPAATENLFGRIWEKNIDITEVSSLTQVCLDIGIPESEIGVIMDRLSTDDNIKGELIEATQKAAEQGIFGLPSFVVDGEIFFGSDRFDHITHHLNMTQKNPQSQSF